jgi:hypothetical protein
MTSGRIATWMAVPLALLIGMFALGLLVRSCDSGALPALTRTMGELIEEVDPGLTRIVMDDGEQRVEIEMVSDTVSKVTWNGEAVPETGWRMSGDTLQVLDEQGDVAAEVPLRHVVEHEAEQKLYEAVKQRSLDEMQARVMTEMEAARLPPEGVDATVFTQALAAAVAQTARDESREVRIDRRDDGMIDVEVRLDPDDFAPALHRNLKRNLANQDVDLDSALRRRLGEAVDRAMAGMARFRFEFEAPEASAEG